MKRWLILIGAMFIHLASVGIMVGFFLPWVHTRPETPQDGWPPAGIYSPATMFFNPFIILFYILPALAVVITSIGLLRRERVMIHPWLAAFASVVGILATLFVPEALRVALAFNTHSIHTARDPGYIVALVAFICSLLGGVILGLFRVTRTMYVTSVRGHPPS